MMNDIQKEYYTSKIAQLHEKNKHKMIYKIRPEYGEGYFIIYRIIEGMYLLFSDLSINDKIINRTNSKYASPALKIDYCIDGNYKSICPGGKLCKVSRGNSVHYAGTKNFCEVDFKDRVYKSISIFCYLNEITSSIENLLGISKTKIKEYYTELLRRKGLVVVNTDAKISEMVNEVDMYLKTNNLELVKIKALEIFVREATINRFSNKKKYYKRSTIRKIEQIKKYIESNMHQHTTINELAKKFDIGATELKQCFKQTNGIGPYTYLKNYRMHKAKELLLNYDYSILEIAAMIGYANQSKFSASFKKAFGMVPSKYRRI